MGGETSLLRERSTNVSFVRDVRFGGVAMEFFDKSRCCRERGR